MHGAAMTAATRTIDPVQILDQDHRALAQNDARRRATPVDDRAAARGGTNSAHSGSDIGRSNTASIAERWTAVEPTGALPSRPPELKASAPSGR